MRLSPQEIAAIKKAILELDPQAEIYLFGSRTDPDKKGGDIDLLVLSTSLSEMDKIPIKARIFRELEEQKIDLIIAKDTSDPFIRLALKTGTQL